MRNAIGWTTLLVVAVVVCAHAASAADRPLSVIVMDPLAKPLSCACVQGFAQRDYDQLGKHLEKELKRPVRIAYGEDLARVLRTGDGRADLLIGKHSVVRADAAASKIAIRPLCMLTDKQGSTTLTGLFVVRTDDKAKSLADLKGYRIFFGPKDCDEKHSAALAALRAAGVAPPKTIDTRAGCTDTALAVLESEASPGAAGVISSYAEATLKGCGVIDEGAIKIVGTTAPVPFVTVFAATSLDEAEAAAVKKALLAAAADKALCEAIESKAGFVEMPKSEGPADVNKRIEGTWPGWRGSNHDGTAPWLPEKLAQRPKVVWTAELNGPVPAGVACDGSRVITADRDLTDGSDIFACFDAGSGKPLWQIEYPAPGGLDYGNAPRATPLLHEGRAYLLGAMGDLHCVAAEGGRVLWKRNLVRDFGGVLPKWGFSTSPLMVDGRLIVAPGAKDAALAALDPGTGDVIWQSPGLPAAYASPIVGTFGGVRQIVGYDAQSAGGWDAATGNRLWTLVPKRRGDFNVPTPIDLGGRLLLSSESNGTRIFGFDDQGRIIERPAAEHEYLSPDASTPVVLGDKVLGCWNGLFCLDAANGLKELWRCEDDAFSDYVSLIGCGDRLLATTLQGELLLLTARPEGFQVVSRLSLFSHDRVLSHPAVVGKRLYIRGGASLLCVSLVQP